MENISLNSKKDNCYNLAKIQDNLYNFHNNFKIVNTANNKICYVFCSSNGLGNKIDNSISNLNEEYFEWENISKNKKIFRNSGKYIFLRDVYLRSYVDGINKEINSINKIVDFLVEQTKGYDVICVGTSGGGYLSMILGARLKNCIRVYSFGGLFSLYTWRGAKSNYSFNDIQAYVDHINDENFTQYYEIKDLIQDCRVNILHFYGKFNSPDCTQMEELKEISNNYISTFAIKSNHHGGQLYGFSYPHLLALDGNKLLRFLRFRKNTITKQKIAIACMGLPTFCFAFLKSLITKLFRHIRIKK